MSLPMPPKFIVGNGRIENLREIEEWARLHDPIWNRVMYLTQGWEPYDRLAFLAVAMLDARHFFMNGVIEDSKRSKTLNLVVSAEEFERFKEETGSP